MYSLQGENISLFLLLSIRFSISRPYKCLAIEIVFGYNELFFSKMICTVHNIELVFLGYSWKYVKTNQAEKK